MKRFLTLILITLLTNLAASASNLSTADANKLFNDLFGQDYKAALASRDHDDNITLAERLIKSAPLSKDQPKLATLMCEKAYTLTSRHPSGYPTAINAMNTLAQIDPTQSESANTKSLMLRKRLYISSRGDDREKYGRELLNAHLADAQANETKKDFSKASLSYNQAYAIANAIKDDRKDNIKQKVVDLAVKSRMYADIDKLKANIRKDPKDTQSKKELFRIYVVELDEPETARKFSFLFKDIEQAEERLKNVTTDLDAINADQSLNLATWYFETLYAGPGTDSSKPKMLSRAKTYYTQFLSLYEPKDIKRVKATLTLQKIDNELKLLGPVTPKASSRTVDLINFLDPKKHNIKGTWFKNNNVLYNKLSISPPCIAAPIYPDGDYQIDMIYKNIDDSKGYGFIINLPVGDNVTSILAASVKGGFGISGPDAFSGQLESPLNVDMQLTVTVKHKNKSSVNIQIKHNNKIVQDWTGDPATLKQSRFATTPPHNVIAITPFATFHYSKFTLKMLTGKIIDSKDKPAVAKKDEKDNKPDLNGNPDFDNLAKIREQWENMTPAQRSKLLSNLRQLRPDDWQTIMRQLAR